MASLRIFLILCAFFATAFCLPEETDENIRKQILEEHNKLRVLHHADPLTLDRGLCDGAQIEAERYLKSYNETGAFTRNPDETKDREYNDNVLGYHSYGKRTWNGQRVVAEWVKQKQIHNWEDNFFDPKTGHFTQMVWTSTEAIGVGIATGRNLKREYIKVFVVRYAPPGNIMDRETFRENVLPEIRPANAP